MSKASRVRVLVVEDEWLIADHLRTMLIDLGYDVIGPVPTVKEALALVEAENPDAAVLDVSLETGKSFPVAEAMSDRGAPFIFLTGYVSGDLPPAFQGKPIINKPVSLLDLKTPLEAMTAAARQAA